MTSFNFVEHLKVTTSKPCANLCGLCPSCVFLPKQPEDPVIQRKSTDKYQRMFLVELILKCEDISALQRIQTLLSPMTWPVSNYVRSTPVAPPPPPQPALEKAPTTVISKSEIWDWFRSSSSWVQSHYICCLLSFCDAEQLRMFANLVNVHLTRLKQGLRADDRVPLDGEIIDPVLLVIPGSSESMSGVSLYKDLITNLPVDLAKRIFGLRDDHDLQTCQRIGLEVWKLLAIEVGDEKKFRRGFHEQVKAVMERYKGINWVSPTFARMVEVLVPCGLDQEEDTSTGAHEIRSFENAYANMKTKAVQMEERNIYCSAYYTTVVLDKEDTHRVVDYRGQTYMALGSKDCSVHLLYVGTKSKFVSALKGHVGSIRAVLMCEEKGIMISGSCDTSIRCWSLRTDQCVMALYGHTGSVNCLDIYEDRLVSGAKDCQVKVWNLQTGRNFYDMKFKHPGSVRCVKISATTVFSACDRGLVKVWDMDSASLIRVITGHKSSVRCLFYDEWHLLSGDFNGQLMVWSINCEAKDCLMTFNHPKEVKAVSLTYLRVITGCVDGKIRVFNFLNGDCIKIITAEVESSRILSVHFNERCILVNTASRVRLILFGKVFWDHVDPGDRVKRDHQPVEESVTEESLDSPTGTDLSVQKSHTTQDCRESTKTKLSEKATSSKKGSAHHSKTESSSHPHEKSEAKADASSK
ncbi:F-box/WD repeat-containing protein 10 [Synchiropus picturatus]